MIYILSWTTKKHFKKTLSRPLLSKLKQIQGLFKTVRYETEKGFSKRQQKQQLGYFFKFRTLFLYRSSVLTFHLLCL